MGEFEIIETGFDCADETINFGTRSIGYDSLYEISTIACLKSSIEEKGFGVNLHSEISNGKMVLGINQSLKIFRNVEEISSLTFNMSFQSNILSMATSKNGKYVLICLANGLINLFHTDEPSSPIFSQTLFEFKLTESSRYVKCFQEEMYDGLLSFVVILSPGTVYRVVINEKLQPEEKTTCALEKLCDLNNVVRIATFSFPFLIMDGNEFCVYNIVTQSILADSSHKMKTIAPFGHYVIGLDENGFLYRYCIATLLSFPMEYDYMVEEIITIEDQQKKQILLCTKIDEQENLFLQLLNSDFTRIFSVKVSSTVSLIQLEKTTDDILFLSQICSENSVPELRIQRVYETQPDLRIMKLIRKQQFQEAEKFATMFNIDSVVILKAKAELIVEKTECSSDDIVNLLNLLDAIDDDAFKLQCCSQIDCGNLKDVRKILTYGVKIVPKNNEIKHLRTFLCDVLYRFDTFMALSGDNDISSWSKFMVENLVDKVKLLLKNYNIEDAIIVYNRLDRSTADTLTEENVKDILHILNNLPTNESQPFLSTFIPITMMHMPASLSIFVSWLYNRILHLEKRDCNNFPENGILLAQSILKLMRAGSNTSISFQRYQALNKEGIDELANLMEGLQTLQKLKKDYKVNIPLAEYLKGPEVLVKSLLNIIMPPEDYENFLKGFLYTYLLQNKFDPDTIFFDEIKEFIKYGDCWIYVIETLLKYISSIEIKLCAIKEILEKMPVPWNNVIRKIGKESLQYSHPLTLAIKNILKDENKLVILGNPKYKVKNKNITTIDELRRVIERIIYVNEPNFLEHVYNMCKSLQEKHEANIIIFKRFVMKGNIDGAISFLDTCNKEEMYECAKWHFSNVEIFINSKFINSDVRDYYYKVLFPLYRRVHDVCDDHLDREFIEKRFYDTRAVYIINKFYGQNIITDDFRRKKCKMDIFDKIIEELANNIIEVSDSLDINRILNICATLEMCFQLENDFILVTICNKIGNLDLILKAAEHMLETETKSKNLCLIVVLFLKYFGTHNRQYESFNESSVSLLNPVVDAIENNIEDRSEVKLYLDCLNLCQKIISKALINAEDGEICAIHQVFIWLNSCFYLSKRGNVVQMELCKNLFVPDSCIPSFDTFSTIRNAFDMCTSFIGESKQPHFYYITYFRGEVAAVNTEEQLFQQFSNLHAYIDTMCKEGQHLTAFKLLKTIKDTLSIILPEESRVIECVNSVLKKCLHFLIQIVASAKYIDITLLYTLLLAARKDYLKYVHYYLKMYRRQPRKLQDLSILGIKLLDFHEETQSRDVMLKTVVTCKWWKKLKIVHNKLQYETFFMLNALERLSQIISLDLVDVTTIQEYCEDFNTDAEPYYKEYLKSCLLNWKPDYECQIDLDGNTSVLMRSSQENLHAKVSQAIEYIKDKKEIVPLLENILTAVNFYYYEVFICIYNILKNNYDVPAAITGDLLVLTFLKDYKRYSPPSQREKEEWYTTFPDCQVLDPLSEYRLPFTRLLFTSDIWSIIRPEINLKSYKFWFDVTNVLQKNLKRDDICVYAIKQVVTSGILGDTITGDWILYPKLEDLIQEVDECAQNISNLERATSVIYHLMNYTPNGADKMNAARLSFSYATKYRENCPNSPDVEKAFIKVKNKFYVFSAMHILYKFNLADEKYLQLVSHAESLVESLYMDDRILKQTESVNFSCPDVNSAVDAISHLFQLDIEKIRYNLLNSWLKSSTMDVDFDSTIVFSSESNKNTSISEDSDPNLKRAIYLCGSNSTFWITTLISAAFDEDDVETSEQNNILFKSKALKCLCAITDEETIVRLTKLMYKEFLNYVDKLTLLSQLQYLGIYLNIETLNGYNKKDLLKRLSQMDKVLAIKVMGAICITYSMFENRYWDFIINNSIKWDMITELKTYVIFLINKSDTRYYVRAWQKIIDYSFQHIDTENTEDADELYVINFLMIQSSPVLFSLDFECILQHCISKHKLSFAAVLLQYLPEDKKMVYATSIQKNKHLLLELDNLKNKGIWGVGNVKSWLRRANMC